MFKEHTQEEAYLKTLKWINKMRAKQGDPPLEELIKGRRGSIIRCALANSIGHNCTVNGNSVIIPTDETHANAWKMVRLPSYAQWFTSYFDAGWYPDLVEKAQVPVAK